MKWRWVGGWWSEVWERTHESLTKKNSLDLPLGCNKTYTHAHTVQLKSKLYARACNRELFLLYMPKYTKLDILLLFHVLVLSTYLYYTHLFSLGCSWQLFKVYSCVYVYSSVYMVFSFIHRFSAKRGHSPCTSHATNIFIYTYIDQRTHTHTYTYTNTHTYGDACTHTNAIK